MIVQESNNHPRMMYSNALFILKHPYAFLSSYSDKEGVQIEIQCPFTSSLIVSHFIPSRQCEFSVGGCSEIAR